MGCVSVPTSFILQRPALGVALNVRKKNKLTSVSVLRRPHYVISNSLSVTRKDSSVPLKEDTEFKSSFDEYLKAMESIRADREEKKAQKGSSRHKKKLTDTAFGKDVPHDRKREDINKLKRFKGSDFKEENESSKGSRGVVNKGRLVGVQVSNFVRSRKEANHLRSEDGSSKKGSVSKEENESSKGSRGVVNKGRLVGSVQASNFIRSRKEANHLRSEDVSSKKGSGFEEENESSKGLHGAVNKGRLVGSVQASNFVRSRKEVNHIRSEDGSSKKGSGSKAENKSSKGSRGVADKGGLVGSGQAHDCVRSRKEVNYLRSEDGSSKKQVAGTTGTTSAKLVRIKSLPMKEIGGDDELETDTFSFLSSELLDNAQDGRRVSRMEMEERIQKLVRRLDDADIDMPEWMFSKAMRSAKIRFCDHSLLRIIQILGKLGNWRRVLQVIQWLQMHERYKSRKIRYVYTAALGVLGKLRRPVEALNLFCAMQRHKTLYPDIVAYHSIAVTLGQAGHMKELFEVIDSMRSVPQNFKIDVLEDWDPQLEPDIVVYNAVLNACVKRKEWEGTFWVLEKLAQAGQQPSSTTYGLVMEVMLACGKYDLVHEFFRELKQSSIPNALTYRVLVSTFWKEGKADEAIAAVQDMESQRIVGSASLYYDLARCLCSVGRCEEALMQVDKICKVASKPLVVTYTGLIQACLESGKVHDGASIFNHMHNYCTPNLATCNIMLKGYLGHGMFDEAIELFQKMIQSTREVKGRITPDIYTFKMMMEACIREERWDDFEYAYEQMLLHGHPFNKKHHLWMVLQASRAGKVKVVESTWRHFIQANRVPPSALIKERFRLKLENDDLAAAVSSINCHLSSHQKSFTKEAWLKLFEDNAHQFKKEALEQLITEVKVTLSKSESPNLVYQNLLHSCVEFVRVDKPVAV